MLRIDYYGQNIGYTVPNVTLTGDPGSDQATLAAAGFIGGRIMAIVGGSGSGEDNIGALIAPADAGDNTFPPFGVLLNNGGEFSGSIGPSGSSKAPVVRALFTGSISSESYLASDVSNFKAGAYVYCGGGANAGLYTASPAAANAGKTAFTSPVGICVHPPTATEAWLKIASLL